LVRTIGISEEDQKKIFLPFSQLRTGSATGSGLGLSIATTTTKLLGGTISVESRGVGHGATFRVSLPLRFCPNVEISAGSEPPHPIIPKGRAMVVDDNDLVLRLNTRMCTRAGFQVTTGTDGDEAVNLFKSHPFGYWDLAIIDINMPRMNGTTAIQQIRQYEAAHEQQRMCALALTANSSTNDVEECLRAGFDGVLPKPCNWQSLLASLQSVNPKFAHFDREVIRRPPKKKRAATEAK